MPVESTPAADRHTLCQSEGLRPLMNRVWQQELAILHKSAVEPNQCSDQQEMMAPSYGKANGHRSSSSRMDLVGLPTSMCDPYHLQSMSLPQYPINPMGGACLHSSVASGEQGRNIPDALAGQHCSSFTRVHPCGLVGGTGGASMSMPCAISTYVDCGTRE